jgi:hypothetical protein
MQVPAKSTGSGFCRSVAELPKSAGDMLPLLMFWVGIGYLVRIGGKIMWSRELRPQVGTGMDSRAGYLDPQVLIVLTLSLTLAALVLGVAWLGYLTL